MSGKSEFSKQAADYAKYRPVYPAELYPYLKSVSPADELAYDAGTGNGQCAVALANHFKAVVASDLSREQIANAKTKANVTYTVSAAHESGIEARSVDLITAATAIHWFNFDLFYAECHRILKDGGVIAAWSYGWHQCEDPKITDLIQKIGKVILKDHWSPQPKLIWDNYSKIPFPFKEFSPPAFHQSLSWDMDELIGYLTTWSATQKYIDDKGTHPVDVVRRELATAWGNPEKKLQFDCPLIMRIGRHSA